MIIAGMIAAVNEAHAALAAARASGSEKPMVGAASASATSP